MRMAGPVGVGAGSGWEAIGASSAAEAEVEAQPQQAIPSEAAGMMPAKRALEPANCTVCGKYQKLAFKNGIKTRDLCGCAARPKRRPLTYKQPDVAGAFKPFHQAAAETVGREDAYGHVPMIANSMALTWCIKCGSYTNTHIKDLGRVCNGTPGFR